MRIAVISMFERGFGGGSGSVAHDMAHHFAAAHEVALICPGTLTSVGQLHDRLSVLQIASTGTKHIRIPNLSKRNIDATYSFLDNFAPDIVHTHDPTSLNLIGQLWAKMHGIPLVYTSHVLPTHAMDFGGAEVLDFLSSPWAESLTLRAQMDYLKHCDAVIALNDSAAADIANIGYRGKVYKIPNGRDVSHLARLALADVSSPDRVLTFIGMVNERKNQGYLVQMLKFIPSNYRLQIVGEALDRDYFRQLVAVVQADRLSNVEFVGPVAHSDVPNLLQNTHLFVSASKMEVQSLVIVEALASGTPVVGLSNETIDELVDSNVGFKLPKDTAPELFARKVRDVCELPVADYERLCLNARDRVRPLDWPIVRDQTIAAYRELVADHVASREPGVQIRKIISLVPLPEVRQALEDRMPSITKAVQRSRVPPVTRFWVAITRAVSIVVTYVLSPFTWLVAYRNRGDD